MMDEPRDLAAMLRRNAARFPDKPALCFVPAGPVVTEQLSFAGLERQVLQLAAALRTSTGVEDGARVLLMLPTSLGFALAFLSGVCAGLVPVPLFPLPARRPRHFDRLRAVVSDAQPSLCLCEPQARETVQAWLDELGLPCRALTVDELRAAAVSGASELPRGELAFLQYTSGSTSRPKGVQVTQRSLLANIRGIAVGRGLTADDRVVTFIPLYHDMGLIGGMLTPLYGGMTCYLMPTPSFIRSPRRWLDAISCFRGTLTFAPDFAFRLCARTVDAAAVSSMDLRCLRHAISGGEPIHASTLHAFAERFAAAGFDASAFAASFGQAEATLCISTPAPACEPLLIEVDRAALAAREVRPAAVPEQGVALCGCGPVLPDHELAIVDPESFERCADGRVGEIWFRGPSVAAGYFRQPAATRETFEARIAAEDGTYLRTGDLGFVGAGQLFICGRLKDLIIIAGRNVYPHDLELAVTQAARGLRVGRVVAFGAWNDALGRQELWIVAEPEQRHMDAARTRELFARMQDACVEVAETAADRLVLVKPGSVPLTSSGKLSRSSTRELALSGLFELIADSAEPGLHRELFAQAAEHERGSLCREWLKARLARLRPSAAWQPERSLLAYGCDSLALTQLMQELRALGYDVSARELFGELSVAEHAARWAAALQRVAAGESAVPPAAPLPFEVTSYRLSAAQERLWFLHELDPARSDGHIALCLQLRGNLDVSRLERSLQWLVDRHAVLRTRYRSLPEGAWAECQAQARIALPCHDLSELAAGERAARRSQLLAEERARPFPLHAGAGAEGAAAMRARLLVHAPDQHELLLVLHHLAVDGRSAALLLGDLDRVYAAAASGGDLPSARGVQFLPRERVQPALIEEALAFYRAALAGLSRALPAVPTAPGAGDHYRRFELSAELCARLDQLARGEHTTPFLLLLTLFGVTLRHVSGVRAFVIGTDVAGRPDAQARDVVGFFVNQLPLRCDVRGEPSLRELVARQRRDALAAYAYEQVPFDAVAGALPSSAEPSLAKAFGLKLNYQPAYLTRPSLGPLRIERAEVLQERGAPQLVLDLVREPDGRISACLEAAAALPSALVRRVERVWCQLIAQLPELMAEPLPRVLAALSAFEAESQRQAHEQGAARLRSARRQPLAARPEPSRENIEPSEKP